MQQYSPEISHQVHHQTLSLLPEKAIYWNEQDVLIFSDLHLGKAMHFRKNGIQAPLSIIRKELDRITELLLRCNPKIIVIVGDLFHSDINSEWFEFEKLVASFGHIKWYLVRGNHDSIPAYLFKLNGITVSTSLLIEPFLFVHQPESNSTHYVISGHIHPGVVLNGKGRQQIKLPCFYFGQNYALLPAFGKFTGIELIQPSKNDYVYGVTQTHVISLYP